MTTRRTLFAAALLLVGAVLWTSCQKEAVSVRDEAPADIPEGCLWLSLEASKAADTKALVLEGSTLNAYWEADEHVEVFLGGDHIGTLTATPKDGDNTKATLSGTVSDASGIAENAVLTLLFPKETWSYASQGGTLASIAANYDYAAAEVEVVSVDGTNVTTTRASFVNRQSIYKLTFTGLLVDGIASVTIHSAGNKLVASSAVGGSSTYGDVTVTLDDAARTANGEGVVYATLRFDALEAGQTDELTITVTDTGSNTYVATKTSPSGGFINGKYYTSTMRRIVLDSVTDTDGEGLKYVAAQDGDIITGHLNGYITIPDGAAVTLDGAEIHAPLYCYHAAIHCFGSAHVILNGVNNADAGYLSSHPAVLAAHNDSVEEYTLTISGTGSLEANSQNAEGSAGIGGGNQIPCGNIVIAGGTINARGGGFSAGIGGGDGQSGGENTCGDITISGGVVTATGGSGGAGIGSGAGNSDGSNSCGAITISGGVVTATGGNGGAGIGNGYGECGGNYCDNITISGGEVTATGGRGGAGIGSGDGQGGGTNICGAITISGGSIGDPWADSGAFGGENAAGIGCGWSGSCLSITITGGIEFLRAIKGSADDPIYQSGYCIIGYGRDCLDGSCGTVTIADEEMDDHQMKYGVNDSIGGLYSNTIGTPPDATTWELFH